MSEELRNPIGLVNVDGLYGASQFHLRTNRQMTDRERLMILYAVQLPGSGFVDAQTVAMRRVLITTTVGESERVDWARRYSKVINQVLEGRWLWEYSHTPAVKTVGKPYDHLHLNYQTQIGQQWAEHDVNHNKTLRWWRASGADPLLANIRAAMTDREERRGQ